MSKIYKVRSWEDNDALDPALPNEELAEITGEMNGHLDRDNVRSGQLLTGAKFAVDTFNTIAWLGGLTTGSVTLDNASDLYQWHSIASTTMTTEDGRLIVIASYSYDLIPDPVIVAGNENDGAELGIRIDGTIVSRSGQGGQRGDSVAAQAAAPVGAGDHTIELVARYGAIDTYNHIGGGAFIRFLKR